MINSVTENE